MSNHILYVTRRLSAGDHVFHNEIRGGSYRVIKSPEGWTIFPCNSITLQHTGYRIGMAATLSDVADVLHAFEY